MLVRTIQRIKNFLIGGALLGLGSASVDAAPRTTNAFLMAFLLVAGLASVVAGVRILWIAWKKSKDEEEEQRKPPSIL